ncbi:protein serine/threonine kinase, putative [Entamoeba invadens IP1]|uniref:protein serine/threonine kinase, putative n=1 Tax=Entamoeba invadens IP1 TaxID=370355 RepID=UPI0002C3CFF1|nr:protein serine/threonine kinase, putative [Entamoeba invadens IP1]ELP93554.1 protein serine/threonine kinase, putative [Entamoeba invadens IP1]|eukprot:XP_004260325.1 protein serine/threonine kinase, putative [Entamoeba invadens IP1]
MKKAITHKLECQNTFGEGCTLCNYNDGCQQCQDGYQIVNRNTQKCSDFSEGCLLCSDNKCSSCATKYFLSSSSLKCEKCSVHIPNCETCIEDQCITCIGNTRTLLDNTCVHCNERWEGCVNCDNFKCTKCEDTKYYFLNGMCERLLFYRFNSKEDEVTHLKGVLKDASKCLDCSTRKCKECTKERCSSCLENSFLSSDHKCVSCQEKIGNCLRCADENAVTKCLLCAKGYYANGSSCVKCDDTCGSEGCYQGKCISCKDHLIFDNSGNCVTTPSTCKSSQSGYCTSCISGYYLYGAECITNEQSIPCKDIQIKEDVCVSAKDINCLKAVSNKCETCNTTVYKDGGICKTCPMYISNCQSCTTSSSGDPICGACRMGYFPEKMCRKCSTIDGCQNCINVLLAGESARICTECKDGYFLDSDYCIKIPNCVSSKEKNCLKCEIDYFVLNGICINKDKQIGCLTTDGIHCTSCSSGFYLSEATKICTLCLVTNCTTCSTTGVCIECYTNNTLSSGGCRNCDIEGCYLCNNKDVTCLQCDKTHFIDVTNKSICKICSTKTDHCLECEEKCTLCSEGYFLDTETHDCRPCSSIEGCLQCRGDLEECFTCNSMYFLDNGKCFRCNSAIPRCNTCNDESKCIECENGYYLDNNKCFSCDTIEGCGECSNSEKECWKCQNYYYSVVNTSGLFCVECHKKNPNCAYCRTDGHCAECDSEYTFNKQYECVDCKKHFKHCEICDHSVYRCSICKNGYGFNSGDVCRPCIEITQGRCTICESQFKCTTCSENHYLKEGKCIPCSQNHCEKCDASGYCFMCEKDNYLENGKCHPNDIDNCNKVSTVKKECLECEVGYYPKDGSCSICSTFGNKCEECNTQQCTKCKSGNYLNSNGDCFECKMLGNCTECEQTSSKCTKCSEGTLKDGICNGCHLADCIYCNMTKESGSSQADTCLLCGLGYHLNGKDQCEKNSVKGCLVYEVNKNKCTKCQEGYYNESDNCQKCSSSLEHCSTCSDKTKCLSCTSGYSLINNQCQKCSQPNCKTCSTTSNTCDECTDSTYYLTKEGKCAKCDTNGNGTDCLECLTSSDVFKCIKCNLGSYVKDGVCVNLNKNEYKSSETSARLCSRQIANCHSCNYTSTTSHFDVTKLQCKSCVTGTGYRHGSSTKTCEFCPNEVDDDSNCIACGTGCSSCFLSPENTPLCVKCSKGFALRNNTCVALQNMDFCLDQKPDVGCESCTNYLTKGTNCSSLQRTNKCSFYNEKNECQPYHQVPEILPPKPITRSAKAEKNNCKTNEFKKGKCYACAKGFSLDTSNPPTCSNCNCVECNILNQCKVCLNETNDYNGTCEDDSQCDKKVNNTCLKCKQKHYLTKGKCSGCSDNCLLCSTNQVCTLCATEYVLVNNKCLSQSDAKCLTKNTKTNRCELCDDGFYMGNTNECVATTTKDCQHEISGKCKLCQPSLLLGMSDGAFVCTKDAKIEHCDVMYRSGCISCENGFYINSQKCEKCDGNCAKCVNASKQCISCYYGSFLNSKNNTCTPIGKLKDVCRTFFPTGGCAVCQTGYLWQEKSCYICDVKCSSCSRTTSTCLSCNYEKGYYQKDSPSGIECIHNSTLKNCEAGDRLGCTKCVDGYYLDSFRDCIQCTSPCASCTSQNNCISCVPDHVLVSIHQCVLYTTIPRCLTVENNKCTSCEGYNYRVSNKGTECLQYTNLGLALGLPISLVFILIIMIMFGLFVIIFFIRKHQYKKMKERTVCEFDISHSNVNFVLLNSECGLIANKRELNFLVDRVESVIPVEIESRDLLCVGNKSSKSLKIQLSTKNATDKYEIRTNPQLITLKKGKAVEFEVFIRPLCTCSLHERIALVVLDLQKGKQFDVLISLKVKTTITTRLDYDELKEKNKIGEGSFGIVYKGTFRDKEVAIKKMKVGCATTKELEEFFKEVSMLDKFRSDYLVHFYGAVMIPNKICMVNEYCQHGSIKDLMKRYPTKILSYSMTLKFLLDGAKGILYLHENGILHRDIKPDNFLVTSIHEDVLVNAKLTDFGSSRNINAIYTNMTFTKGVGTPNYMSPEVLDKRHYKFPADIYSYAVSMFEIVKWGPAFPKGKFKHAWDIANFVTSGQRPEIVKGMRVDIYEVICDCWKQYSSKRLTTEKLVFELNKMYQQEKLK